MAESSDNINIENSINLARNTPIALVVGAAGFLGSHLVEKLLEKHMQVIGVDDFSTGHKRNLDNAFKDKDFHFINQNASKLTLDLPRLDYIFIIAGGNWSLKKVLDLSKEHKSKTVLVSSIELYNQEVEEDLSWFKSAESEVATFAKEHNLNARVVRIAAVYGPRMHFKIKEPAVKLIKSSLTDKLQKESSASEFSTRALYVDDGVELIIKSMLSGATAQKIFDGCLTTPIKVAEIKQVLLDPIWYESKGFIPSELPPWPTPNLEKTIKFLSWEPKTTLVKGLKETINYFKDNEIDVSEINPSDEGKTDPKEIEKIEPEKKQLLKEWKEEKVGEPKQAKKKRFNPSFLYKAVALGLILYALVLPVVIMGISAFSFKHNLSKASNSLNRGDFGQAQKNVDDAQGDLGKVLEFVSFFDFASNLPIIGQQIASTNTFLVNLQKLAQASAHGIRATENLYKGLKATTGELTEKSDQYFATSLEEFSAADLMINQVKATLESSGNIQPALFIGGWDSLKTKLDQQAQLIEKGRVVATILPSIIGKNDKKTYLVLFQNNNELRPTGGFIGSYARIDFEGGKLKRLEVNDIYAIDGQLNLHVEPPKEIKEDLGQKDWFLRDSNWEPDFPTAARQAAWFYTKETGVRADGVIALDLKAIENLLSVMGPLDIADYNEKVTSENLFATSIAHAETGFFPGSQSKKNFLTALANQLFDKLFFLPNQNWPGIVSSLDKSLAQKHFMIYLDDPKLFSYMASQNWAGVLPRPDTAKEGSLNDFLAVVEANLGANKSNYYVDRNYQLDTTIGKEGEITHRLKINYTNRSPANTWPAGTYKNRVRVYLPFGAKLSRALVDKEDITGKVTTFADYGRAGYSLLISIDPKQTKSIVLDYSLGQSLSFVKNMASYRLDVIKQAGTSSDPIQWRLTYPLNYKIEANTGQNIGPQEHTISTDLSTDRSFQVTFTK